MRSKALASTTDAIKILHQQFFAGRPERIAELNQTRREMMLGLKIRRVRLEAGLTQAALAKRIGTQTSAISRIELADYDGNSVQTLSKIADALGMRLVIDMEPKNPPRRRVKLA
jgi:DNA-binding XRE family transcriptional regulator